MGLEVVSPEHLFPVEALALMVVFMLMAVTLNDFRAPKTLTLPTTQRKGQLLNFLTSF